MLLPRRPATARVAIVALLSLVALVAAACGGSKPVGHRSTATPSGTAPATGRVTPTGTDAATPSATDTSITIPSPQTGSASQPGTSPAQPSSPAQTTARAPSPAPAATYAVPTVGLPNFSHVVVILMENEEYGSIIGNANAPYINSLAGQGALATQYYAISHPSLPNYLALSGGSTFGISSDCNPGPGCQATRPGLADQLAGAGISWKGYMEDLPGPCARSDSGNYAVRHDPFVYYPSIVSSGCGNVVPASQLTADLASGQLPRFAWVTPNLCDDMHDSCGGSAIAHGDAYLHNLVPQILSALGPGGVVFVTFDEGSSNAGGGLPGAAGGQVTTIAAGAPVKAGYRTSVRYDHYSLLRTIEDAWGLAPLGSAALSPAMRDLFTGS
ncbi:MAG TPA: alkaline phosphatase family protein [Actinomycetota bacterium]|nr:alkaline phosphatase family protein [Actinomycetota bacterium]